MKFNKESLNDYRLHAITLLTGASALMSQVEDISTYSPVAAGLACLLSATSYAQILNRVDDLADALEESGVIDEEMADKIDKATDVIEDIVDGE